MASTTSATRATASRSEAVSAEGGRQVSRQVSLHPLAIVGVSDHLTRVKVGGSKQPATSAVIGVLFGKQDDLEVSIFDAIEVAYDDDTMTMDEGFLTKQVDLYTAVYKDKELLGWYAVASEATSGHLALHKDFLKFNESPLFLLMDPSPSVDELPIQIFEYELHVVQETPTMLFAPVPWRLETLQAEQIAMEQVAKTKTDSVSETAVVYEAMDNSLKTLAQRVENVATYLSKVNSKELPVNYALLRDIANLVDKLPTTLDGHHHHHHHQDDTKLEAEFLRDLNDSLAVSYLAALTKSANAANDLVDKFGLIHTHHHHHHHPAKLA